MATTPSLSNLDISGKRKSHSDECDKESVLTMRRLETKGESAPRALVRYAATLQDEDQTVILMLTHTKVSNQKVWSDYLKSRRIKMYVYGPPGSIDDINGAELLLTFMPSLVHKAWCDAILVRAYLEAVRDMVNGIFKKDGVLYVPSRLYFVSGTCLPIQPVEILLSQPGYGNVVAGKQWHWIASPIIKLFYACAESSTFWTSMLDHYSNIHQCADETWFYKMVLFPVADLYPENTENTTPQERAIFEAARTMALKERFESERIDHGLASNIMTYVRYAWKTHGSPMTFTHVDHKSDVALYDDREKCMGRSTSSLRDILSDVAYSRAGCGFAPGDFVFAVKDGNKRYLLCLRTFALVEVVNDSIVDLTFKSKVSSVDEKSHEIELIDALLDESVMTEYPPYKSSIKVINGWDRGVQANALFFRKVSMSSLEEERKLLKCLHETVWTTDPQHIERLPLDEEFMTDSMSDVNKHDLETPKLRNTFDDKGKAELDRCAWASRICVEKVKAEREIVLLLQPLISKEATLELDAKTKDVSMRILDMLQKFNTRLLTVQLDTNCTVIDMTETQSFISSINLIRSSKTSDGAEIRVWIHVNSAASPSTPA